MLNYSVAELRVIKKNVIHLKTIMNIMNFKVFKAAAIVAVIFMLLPLKAVGQANTYYSRGGGKS